MSNEIKTKSLVEGALLAAITVILGIASIYIPVLGVFVSFVWPVPIILLCIRHGLKISILASVVSGLIVFMVAEPIQAITVILGFGLMGVSMGYAIYKEQSSTKVMIAGGAASLVSKLILILVYLIIMGINPFTQQIAIMEETLPRTVEIYRNLGVGDDVIRQMEEMLGTFVQMARIILPTAIAFAAIFDAYINFIVARLVLGRLGTKIEPLPSFKTWKLPDYTLAIFLAVILSGFLKGGELFALILSNVIYAFTFVFIVQGFAVGEALLEKHNFPKLMRRLILIMILFMPFVSNIYLYGGMADTIFDFRKLKAKEVK
jgi:uncharacterized protein YybS (DUF2232 family)